MGKRHRGKFRGPPKPKSAAASGAKPRPKPGPAGGPSAVAAASPAADLADDFVLYESGSDVDGSVRSDDEGSSSDSASSVDELALAARDDGDAESDVEVTFDFYDPVIADEGPVAAFLADFCDSCAPPLGAKAKYLSATAIAKTVCAQTRVGTVVKISDDAQAIAFISVLNIEAHRELLAPLGAHLRRVCGVKESAADGKEKEGKDGKEKGDGEKFYGVLAHSFSMDEKSRGARVGFILTDRVVNLPPQLVPKMQEALFCEIEWALEDEPTEELRETYNFHWYLYVTDVYRSAGGEGNTTAEGEKKGKKPPKKKARAKAESSGVAATAGAGAHKQEDKISIGTDEVAFTRVEDEMYLAAATHSVMWPVSGGEVAPGGIRKMKMGMLIKKARMAQAVAEVRRVFEVEEDGEDAAVAVAAAGTAVGNGSVEQAERMVS